MKERKRGRKGEYVRNDNQARRALSTSTDLLPFFALPPFLLSSLHSAFCSTAAKSIDPAGHARPVAAPHFHEEEGRGRGIHRSGNFRNKRKEQRRLSRPPSKIIICYLSRLVDPAFFHLPFPPSLPPLGCFGLQPFVYFFFISKGILTKKGGILEYTRVRIDT